jgi:hypothetical protein
MSKWLFVVARTSVRLDEAASLSYCSDWNGLRSRPYNRRWETRALPIATGFTAALPCVRRPDTSFSSAAVSWFP